ncbi:hypothetical protein PENTCL1PPCAC_13353, partial [Pristionchus entomophagus]
TSCGGCRSERKKRHKLEKRLEVVENSLQNIERYMEYLVRNTTAKPVSRYRGVEFLDRDEVVELSRSTPNHATFLRQILDSLYYQD